VFYKFGKNPSKNLKEGLDMETEFPEMFLEKQSVQGKIFNGGNISYVFEFCLSPVWALFY